MDDFFEVDEKKKTVKSINLDDFSIEDLEKYKTELNKEIVRVNLGYRSFDWSLYDFTL